MYKIPVPVQQSQTERLRRVMSEDYGLRPSLFRAFEVPRALRHAFLSGFLLIVALSAIDVLMRF